MFWSYEDLLREILLLHEKGDRDAYIYIRGNIVYSLET